MAVTFLYSLAGGMLAVFATGQPGEIAWRFIRLIGFLTLAIFCAAFAWTKIGGGSPTSGAATVAAIIAATGACVLALLAPFAGALRVTFHVICGASGLAGLTAGCLNLATVLGGRPVKPIAFGLAMTAQAIGGILIGSITIAWLLGHAYLTATRMTLSPLRHFSSVLVWCVIARTAVFALCALTAFSLDADTWTVFFGQSATSWMIVLLRVGVGLVAVGVFAFMVRDCVRLRATQSATGILYFGSVFAYVGELASQQLLAQFGWPM